MTQQRTPAEMEQAAEMDLTYIDPITRETKFREFHTPQGVWYYNDQSFYYELDATPDMHVWEKQEEVPDAPGKITG